MTEDEAMTRKTGRTDGEGRRSTEGRHAAGLDDNEVLPLIDEEDDLEDLAFDQDDGSERRRDPLRR